MLLPVSLVTKLVERATAATASGVGCKRQREDGGGAADGDGDAAVAAADDDHGGDGVAAAASDAVPGSDGPAAAALELSALLRRSNDFAQAASKIHRDVACAAYSALSRLAPRADLSASLGARSLDRGAEALLLGVEGLAASAASAVWASTASPAPRPPEKLERFIYCRTRQCNVLQTWAEKMVYYEDGVEVMVTLPGGGQQLVRRPPLRLWSDAASVHWVRA